MISFQTTLALASGLIQLSSADISDCRYVIIAADVTTDLGGTSTSVITQTGYPLDYCNVITASTGGIGGVSTKYTANAGCDTVTLNYYLNDDCSEPSSLSTDLDISGNYGDLSSYGITGDVTIEANCGNNDCIVEVAVATYGDQNCGGSPIASVTTAYVDGLCTFVETETCTSGQCTNTFTSLSYSCDDNDQVTQTSSTTTSDCTSGIDTSLGYTCLGGSESSYTCNVNSDGSTGNNNNNDDSDDNGGNTVTTNDSNNDNTPETTDDDLDSNDNTGDSSSNDDNNTDPAGSSSVMIGGLNCINLLWSLLFVCCLYLFY